MSRTKCGGNRTSLEAIGGDFFQRVLLGADAGTLRRIIHDWADDEAMVILKNVRPAMKPSSTLALIEEVIAEPPKPTFGVWQDALRMKPWTVCKEWIRDGADCLSVRRPFDRGQIFILVGLQRHSASGGAIK
jgi:hypothetical protein